MLKKRGSTGPVVMGGPVWGGRQAAGKADSQAFSGKRLPHPWGGSLPTKPVDQGLPKGGHYKMPTRRASVQLAASDVEASICPRGTGTFSHRRE